MAATCTTATTGGSWNTAANWSCTSGGNHVPLAADDVVINRNFTVNVATAAVQSVTMSAGTLTQSSALNTAASPAGNVTITGGTITSTAAMNIGGNLNIQSGTVTSNAMSISGATTISSGTLTINSNVARTFTGLVTVNGGIWNNSGNRAVTFQGGLTVSSGTFTAGSGVQTFNTNDQDINGTLTIPSMTITGVTVTNNGTLSITTALAGNALTNLATLNIGFAGPPGITTIDATAVGNIVNYNRGGTQTAKATAYHNLTLSTSNAKTLTGITTIAGDLTVQGTATITGNAAFTVTGALNYASTGGTTTLAAATPISIGKYNQTGGGTFNANNNTITVTGTGAGTWTKSAGTFTPGATGTVIFTGAAPQIGASNFANLTINVGSGNTATLTGNITTSAALTVNANTTLDTGTSTVGIAGNFVVNGTVGGTGAITLTGSGTSISGTGDVADTTNLTISTGAKTVAVGTDLSFAGPITVTGVTVTNNGTITSTATSSITGTGTWVNSTNSTLNVSGTLTPNTLTATASGNTVNYAGAGQTVKVPSGAPATYYNLTLSGSGTKTMPATAMTVSNVFTLTGTASSTLAANLTVGGNLVVSTNGGTLDLATFTANRSAAGGTINVQDNATLKIGSTNSFPSNYTTHTLTAASTVEYGGAAQTVTAETYGNLTLSGSSNKTIGTAGGQTVTIAGNLNVVAGTYLGTTNNPAVNLQGNFSNTGTFTSGSGIFSFAGTAATAQTISGTPTFASLRINNTGSPGGVTMNSNVTASTLLTLNAGVISTGANTLITSANCPGSISRTGVGHVAGFLQLKVPAGVSTCVHHVGDSTTYRPISLTFPSTTTTGNLTGSISQSAGDHGNIATSSLDSAQSVNRFWTLTNGGVGLGGGSYSATLTFVAGDVDTNAAPLTFEMQRWNGASWSAPETAGTNTATTTVATGITGFSDFAAGQRRLNNFLIGGIPGSAVCNPQTLSITARDSSNKTLTNYRGLVTLGTSTNHGDWSVVSAGGTLLNGAADDGAATYQFVAGDLGVASLRLTNAHPETLSVSVNDTTAGIGNASSSYQVDNYKFAITNDTIQVAGRNQAMSVQLNCVGVDTGYTGSKNVKGWVTLDPDDPGGTRPSINAVTLPSSTPGANNLSLTFASGVASFNLVTVDVGKYVLNLRDDSRLYSTGSDIDGVSSTITTRPFALVVSAIKQGSTNNPGGSATSGSRFIAASDTFQATVGAYRWNSAADTTPADGVPDATATLAQITANGAAPSYRWTTTLSAASPFTPATGSLATLSNGVQTGTCPSGTPNCFTNGIATPTNLSYPEAGSFTLAASATNFLNSGINLTAIVFDNSGTPARNGVVGRFYPDHFTLTAGSIAPACAGGAFTYMGNAELSYTLGIDARGKGDLNTGCGSSGKALCNYINSPSYNTGTVSLQAENSDNGTDVGSRLSAPTGTWTAGSYSFSTSTAIFSRPVSPDGPFDSLQIGVTVTDADGPVLAARDMNSTTTGACLPATTCSGKSIGTTIVRFGRLSIGNASGSAALPLTVPVEAQYWNGKAFITNTLDACTSIAASALGSDVAMGSYSTGLNPAPSCKTLISNGGALTSGRRALRLSAPVGQASGNVTLTVNLGAVASGTTCAAAGSPTSATTANRPYLQSGSGFTQNPGARATFGVYRGSEEQIHRQENF